MRRVREMVRLSRDAGLATREVARRTGVAPSMLREMFRRFETSGLTWLLPLDLADAELEARLYGEAGTKQGHRRRVEPDWAALNRKLKRKRVTLHILWVQFGWGPVVCSCRSCQGRYLFTPVEPLVDQLWERGQ